jgi:D-2-hydroxyglutarate dehydrogenase
LDELHDEEARIELKLFELVRSLNGSISAEHGIGQHKRKVSTILILVHGIVKR